MFTSRRRKQQNDQQLMRMDDEKREMKEEVHGSVAAQHDIKLNDTNFSRNCLFS